MGTIRRRPKAIEELNDIWDYVAEDNPDAADRLLRRFDEKLRLLSDSPGIGHPREDLRPGLRSLVVGEYIMFYRAIEGGIALISVVHGRRNIDLLAELGLFDGEE